MRLLVFLLVRLLHPLTKLVTVNVQLIPWLLELDFIALGRKNRL